MDVVDFVTGRGIENQCGDPPSTPGLIAKVVLLFVGIRVTLQVLSRLGSLGRPASTMIIVLECWSFYTYVVYYIRCQPLKGFLLFVLKSIFINLIANAIEHDE